METLIKVVVVPVASAIAGVLIKTIIELARDYFRNRRQKELVGDWYSQSETTPGEPPVRDRIEISISPLGMKLTNKAHPKGVMYEGHARVVKNRYVVGTWRATNRGATASGVFMFVIAPFGEYLAGLFTDFYYGKGYFLEWCLGRTEDDVIKAREYLRTHLLADSHSSPPPLQPVDRP